MDERHAHRLIEGARVAVYIGPHEITGAEPVVTTATVLGPADEERFWLNVDIARDQVLPQMYRVTEIIGMMLPLATVTHSADGSTTYGHLTPEQLREAGVVVTPPTQGGTND